MPNYSLPTLRKLAKRGTNTKLLQWLEGYSQIFYRRGLSEGIRVGTMDVLIKSLSEIDDKDLRREIQETIDELSNVGTDNGGESLESEGGEPNRGDGVDSDDTYSSRTSEEKQQIQEFLELNPELLELDGLD